MTRLDFQNLSEKQTGVRSEPSFIEREVKFCSQILEVWSFKTTAFLEWLVASEKQFRLMVVSSISSV